MEMAGGGRRLVGFAGLGVCRPRGIDWRLVSFSHWFCARAGESPEGLAPAGGNGNGGGAREGIRRGGPAVCFPFTHFSVLRSGLGRRC
jgi:hypothetical protein